MALKKITLVKAAQVPLGGSIRPSGYTAEVDDETYSALLARGQIDGHVPEPAPVGPGAVLGAPATEPEPEPVAESNPPRELPAQTAPLAVWKETADKIGIKTTGMKKPEIIGAVKQHLNL